jgi:hypothetical protein
MTNNYAGSYSFHSRFADIDIPKIMKGVPETSNIVQIQVGKKVLFATRASMRKRGFDAGIQMQTKDCGLVLAYQICSVLYPVVSVDGKFKLGYGKATDEKWNFCIREAGEEAHNQMDWYIDFFNRVEEYYKKLNRVVVRYYGPEKIEVKPIEEVSPIKVGDLVSFIKTKTKFYNEFSTFRVTSICHDYCTIDQPSCYEDGDTICRLSNLVKV